MSRIGLLLIGLAILIILGLFLPWVYKARAEADMRRCQDHLRQIGAFGVFHATLPNQPLPEKARQQFPAGTIITANLLPEQRLSWYASILGALDQGPVDPQAQKPKAGALGQWVKEIDLTQAWDACSNEHVSRQRLSVALCPAIAPSNNAEEPALVQYLGIGGIGTDTPLHARQEMGPLAGVFNYDEPLNLQTIVDGDGLSNTMSLAETNRNLGPWLRGGPATVRALAPESLPYVGVDRQFGGCHRGRGNYCFADGSVRVLTDTVHPTFFRSLLTIAGQEQAEDFAKP